MHPLILAALIGGATGGVSAKARGTDVGKGILSGAAMGAATSGLGSLIGPSATAGKEVAAQKMIEENAKKKILESNIQSELAKKQLGSEFSKGLVPQSNLKQQYDLLAKQAAVPQKDVGELFAQTVTKPDALKEVPFKNFKKAMDPFGMAQNEHVGRMAYATTPSAAWAGELAFNPPEKKKKKGPPMNMLYGRNPGRFGFGEWFDEDKVKEIYEDKENPYFYPEYAEGGEVSPMVGAAGTAQAVAQYLQSNGVEPTMENVQEVIEKIIAQQQQPYEPMTGLGGQLQRMTQQYARPMGEEVMEESETVQGMNQGGEATYIPGEEKEEWYKDYFNKGMGLFSKKGRDFFSDKSQGLIPMLMRGQRADGLSQGGTPRKYYQEGGLGAMMAGMGDMMPSGDLDMRPGGEPVGPGTGTSDDIPAMLSDGEFVMTAKAVENAGGGDRELGSDRMMNMMRNFEQGGQPSQESQGLGSMEENTMTEMIGPQGMMMEDTMMEGIA